MVKFTVLVIMTMETLALVALRVLILATLFKPLLNAFLKMMRKFQFRTSFWERHRLPTCPKMEGFSIVEGSYTIGLSYLRLTMGVIRSRDFVLLIRELQF